MAQIFRYTLPFSSNDLRLIEEAVERVLSSSRYPCDRGVIREAVASELRHGAPVMFRLVKAGHRACEGAFGGASWHTPEPTPSGHHLPRGEKGTDPLVPLREKATPHRGVG